MHVLSMEEECEYFQRAARFPDLHDAGRLMIEVGLSQKEVLALAKSDVELDRGWLRIHGIGYKARVLPMTAGCRQILIRRLGGDSPLIFPSKRNPAAHMVRISAAHQRVVAEAAREGIIFDFILRDLKGTCFRRMLDAWAVPCEVKSPVIMCGSGGDLRRLLRRLRRLVDLSASRIELKKTSN